MNDSNGCSSCPPGEERFERCHIIGRACYAYDYRTPSGALFACVRPTLAACRAARDEWIERESARTA